MLHKLPNGEWIRLSDVTAITPHEQLYVHHDRNQVIVLRGSLVTNLPFETFADAQAFADRLADAVNQSLRENMP